MKNKSLALERHQIIVWPGVLMFFVLCLGAVGFVAGQTGDERKLELVVQTGHSETVDSVAFSPDGKLLASGGGYDNTLKLWDMGTGQEIKTFKGTDKQVVNVTFSPDGKSIAASSRKDVIIWEVLTGRELLRLSNVFVYGSHFLSFSADGKNIIFETGGEIKLYDVQSGEEKESLKGSYAAVSSKGTYLGLKTGEGTMTLWNVRTGKTEKTLDLPEFQAVAFSPDENSFVTANSDKTIRLWNLTTGKELKTYEGHKTFTSRLKFSKDGKTLLAMGNYGDSLTLWDVETGYQKLSFTVYLGAADISPNGETLAINDARNTITLWNIIQRQKTLTFQSHTSEVSSVLFSSDNKTIVAGHYGRIELWDLPNGQKLKTLHGAKYDVLSLALSTNGQILASGESIDYVRLWDTAKGQELFTLDGNALSITSLAFSPDEKYVAAGSGGIAKLWEVSTGKEIATLKGHSWYIRALAFSQDSKMIVTGEGNHPVKSKKSKIIKIWDVSTGKELNSFEGHIDSIETVGFSFDGKMIVSLSKDREIRLWDIYTGKTIESLSADDPKAIPRVSKISPTFSRNYRDEFVVSSDWRFQIRKAETGGISLFNFKSGELIANLISLDDNDWAIVSPDGRFDASEGALNLMHYAYGLETIDLEQLKEAYYEPGLLAKLLGYSKEPLRSIVPLKEVKLHPEIVEQKFDETTKQLNLKLRNRGGGIGKTEVYLNGKLVVADARDKQLIRNPKVPNETIVSLKADLNRAAFVKGQENRIKIVTSNYLTEIGKGNIQSRGSELVYLNREKEELKLPTLYAIVGGVSDYEGNGLDLRFAAKDAEDFSNALQLGAKRLFCPVEKPDCYDKVQVTTLSTSGKAGTIQPTKENFRKTFAEIATKAKPEDILVVYLSGHGVTLGTNTDSYFYLTKEARSQSKDDLAKSFQTTAISNHELTDWLTPNPESPNDIYVKALKQLLILDTCAAGNFGEGDWKKDKDLSGDQIRAMDFLKDKTGTFILMGSAANRPSYEAGRYGQGLLTYSLLEGIKGSALQKATENIDVRILLDYTEKRVPELGKDLQIDQRPIIKQPAGNTFVIGQMTEAEKKQINLPSPKPILLRPSLGVFPRNNDPLNLVQQLRRMFDLESSYEVVRSRGEYEPQLVFVDDDNFPGGIKISGTYIIEGETVKVKIYLTRDNSELDESEIVSTKEMVVDDLIKVIRAELKKIK